VSTTRIDAVSQGLPRRLSLRKGERGYDPNAHKLSDRIAVLMNGEELPECTSYDVDAGEVMRRCRRADGSFILDAEGVPALEVLKGIVEVRWSKGSAA
jgi:hypothetical protein